MVRAGALAILAVASAALAPARGFTVHAIPAARTAGRTLSLPAVAFAPALEIAHGHGSLAILAASFKGNG